MLPENTLEIDLAECCQRSSVSKILDPTCIQKSEQMTPPHLGWGGRLKKISAPLINNEECIYNIYL